MPPERTMSSMAVEVQHLQESQVRIERSIDKLSDKLDGVGEALTSLVRLTEKHDALTDRVERLEEESKSREVVANSGKAYMAAAKYFLPMILAAIASYVGWVHSQVREHDAALHRIDVQHAEKKS